MKGLKFSFFYRTRDEFAKAIKIRDKIDSGFPTIKRGCGFGREARVSVKSPQWSIGELRNKIPKSRPGKKKYLGTIIVNPPARIDFDIDVNQMLLDKGFELVSTAPNKPKYSEDELTRISIRLKNPAHFKKVTSLLNKKYGDGNWHFRGARKILAKLNAIEAKRSKESPLFAGIGFNFTDIEIKLGILVEIAVVGKTKNLDKLLFKADLMT